MPANVASCSQGSATVARADRNQDSALSNKSGVGNNSDNHLYRSKLALPKTVQSGRTIQAMLGARSSPRN
eukprot:8265665-Alexandrium_andersonii.AAC.1